MAYVVNATWITRECEEGRVRAALTELAPLSRAETGCRYYQVYVTPDEPRVFRIFEVYDDAAAFEEHRNSPHFQRLAIERAVPALEDREVAFFETLDA